MKESAIEILLQSLLGMNFLSQNKRLSMISCHWLKGGLKGSSSHFTTTILNLKIFLLKILESTRIYVWTIYDHLLFNFAETIHGHDHLMKWPYGPWSHGRLGASLVLLPRSIQSTWPYILSLTFWYLTIFQFCWLGLIWPFFVIVAISDAHSQPKSPMDGQTI